MFYDACAPDRRTAASHRENEANARPQGHNGIARPAGLRATIEPAPRRGQAVHGLRRPGQQYALRRSARGPGVLRREALRDRGRAENSRTPPLFAAIFSDASGDLSACWRRADHRGHGRRTRRATAQPPAGTLITADMEVQDDACSDPSRRRRSSAWLPTCAVWLQPRAAAVFVAAHWLCHAWSADAVVQDTGRLMRRRYVGGGQVLHDTTKMISVWPKPCRTRATTPPAVRRTADLQPLASTMCLRQAFPQADCSKPACALLLEGRQRRGGGARCRGGPSDWHA